MHQKVYDVAWSDNRKPGANGKVPPVGNTVDVKSASWTNTIGAPDLALRFGLNNEVTEPWNDQD